MKVKYSRSERIAGLFVVTAVAGAIVFTALAAIQKGWFQSKVEFKTKILTAEGMRPGSSVTISGIRAGEIEDIELLAADNIIVHFQIYEKFHRQIKTDSTVQIIRPFVIGDKAIEVTVGSEDKEMLPPGSFIESNVAFDMMDVVSGKKLGPFLGTLEGLLTSVNRLASAFSESKRVDSFIKMFDRMDPLILNLSKMSVEVTKLSSEFNQIIPQMRIEAPELGKQMSQMISHLNKLTAAITPAVAAVGPDLPRATKRAVEALDEMVVTLKALQKSFLLSGKVKDVKEEEQERERKPTQE
jgi:phospholipid/cholesterol/gamma-HCH transport system substrate-binding protein